MCNRLFRCVPGFGSTFFAGALVQVAVMFSIAAHQSHAQPTGPDQTQPGNTKSSHDMRGMKPDQMPGMNMPDMQMPGMQMPGMNMVDMNPAGMFLMNLSSGTAMNPSAWPMPMIMKPFGTWNTMFMAQGYIMDTQQSGPRGGDKFYSSNWFMANTEHRLGQNGAVQMQLMLSLDPVTMTGRRYPLLFQTGETAYGLPIVDGQHPHDLFMELAVRYEFRFSDRTQMFLYGGPIGDPALGPAAYPHRASASENPMAVLGHHEEDSTHLQ